MRHFIIVILALLCSCSASKTEQTTSATPEVPVDEPVTTSEEKTAPQEELPLWSTYNADDLPDLEKRVELKDFALWKCNYQDLREQLTGEFIIVELPVNSGLTSFSLMNSGTMSPELAAKFPNIKSYKGASEDSSIKARIDTNEEGLFGEFQTTEGKFLLSPYLKGSNVYYALYTEDALPPNPRDESYK